MRNIREWWARQKWKEKLLVQLGIIILLVNLAVWSVCFWVQNAKMQKILLDEDKENVIKQFMQAEYNIEIFVDQVEMISRRLCMEDSFRRLSVKGEISEQNRVYYVNQARKAMEDMQYNYPYLDSIIYYGKNGDIVRVFQNASLIYNYQRDTEKQDWYYTSEICSTLKNSEQKMVWFGGNAECEFEGESSEEDVFCITAARMILGDMGALVLNINMDYFLEMFNGSKLQTGEQLYVIDEKNRIVATRNQDIFGAQREFTGAEDIHKGVYKYVVNDSGEMKQVIVYEISSVGWCFVSESLVEDVVKESRYMRNVLMISCMLSAGVTFAVSIFGLSMILRPLKRLEEEMHKVGDGEFGIILENPPHNELGRIFVHFNEMSLSLEDTFRKNQMIEKEKRRLEMQTLRAQINPHLIYNVLNNIKWKALFNNEKNIAESVSLLGKFLQPIFKSQEIIWSLQEEMDYVKNYVDIMNLLRLGEYTLEFRIPEEYRCWEIPRFILQPIVENCILHGYPENVGGQILITVKREGDDGLLLVEDDGKGIENARLEEIQKKLENNECSNRGIGIMNVNRRIKNHYGENYMLLIRNGIEKGTVVSVRIRLSEKVE